MSFVAESTVSELTSVYDRDGWCKIPRRFDEETVGLLRERIDSICGRRRPEVVYEKDGETVRAVHGCHAFDDLCAALVRHPELVALAESLLGGPVYVYQFKVNLKQAHEGAAWPWHQDFAFWSEEDGMPRPHAVNIAVPLDDVHEDNGPLVVIPGSHTLGLLDLPATAKEHEEEDKQADKQEDKKDDWLQHVSADLTYTVTGSRAESLASTLGKVLITGRAGSIHAFHPSIVHSSSNNLSADRRALLLITYNAVGNAPAHPTRPEFLVERDASALTPRGDGRLRLVDNMPPSDG
ncbi:phytanoyl-CoA dioxygenase family protein [Streptomyces sp. FL07-04A]|uniref:phytanoyl-CoA dioxygenase family protein n=1 Tax=Streptomyces sp. FL07-04A TaxID=3028658 RepID=UPI0029A73D5D|nr:phytanoyl-CoA dioxygenase family protein [Streptomyces sp. FL07-04A]MDX3578134.1 phytanoyl-CoA dioxygenase family protein [Streptomyces sp. FL07-04A]